MGEISGGFLEIFIHIRRSLTYCNPVLDFAFTVILKQRRIRGGLKHVGGESYNAFHGLVKTLKCCLKTFSRSSKSCPKVFLRSFTGIFKVLLFKLSSLDSFIGGVLTMV